MRPSVTTALRYHSVDMPDPSDNQADAICRHIVEQGYATQQEIDDCMRLWLQAVASQEAEAARRAEGEGAGGGEGVGGGEAVVEDRDASGEAVLPPGDADPNATQRYAPSPGDTAVGSGVDFTELLLSNGLVTPNQLLRVKAKVEAAKTKQQIPGFQILAKLGAGANATVYKAKQISLDRVVAIKVLPKSSVRDPEYIERFFAEGRAAGRLNHSNIVGALDVGRSGEWAYFVMEYVEGQTVYDELMENIRYDEEDAVKIMVGVADGLEHAHKAGLIHRDIKPQNIVLTKEGVPKIADMGLAREMPTEGEVDQAMAEEATRDANQKKVNIAVGSPNYMSPEQIRNRPDLDFRADLYSFGATLYYMVTGQVPFDAPTAIGVLKKHLREPLVNPEEINPHISEGLAAVIKVCMKKSAHERYDTTSDLVADMRAIEMGEQPLKAMLKLDPASVISDPGASMADLSTGPSASRIDPDQPPPDDDEDDVKRGAGGLMAQPMFFVAVAGWVLALVLAILWLTGASG